MASDDNILRTLPSCSQAPSTLTVGHHVSHGAVVPHGWWALLTVVIYQPEAVMDSVVCLFRPRLLQGQDREDARCSQGSYSHSPSPSPPPKPPPSPLPSVRHPLLHSSKAFPSSVPVGRGSLKAPTPTTPPPSFPVSPQASHSVLLHKVDEGRALHLHRLPLPVIHGQHEVEEVGFPEVGRGLLLKVCSCQAHTTAGRKAAGNCWKPPEASALQKDPITSEQDSALT